MPLELYCQPQRGKFGPKGDALLVGEVKCNRQLSEVSYFSAVGMLQTTTQNCAPSKEQQPAFRKVAPPPPARGTAVPSLTFSVGEMKDYRDGESYALFKMNIPVGGHMFQTKGSGNVTRYFTIRARAIATGCVNQRTIMYECGPVQSEFSVSVLRKEEVMDGQVLGFNVTPEEEKRRTLLRMPEV